MTPPRPLHVALAVAFCMLVSVGDLAAQPDDRLLTHGRVPLPSSDFTTFTEGELVREPW
jgi:hypothetical protein